ncbi:MAG: nitrogenase iron-molybdenum cofactor biosynthesis protein NifE [Magnetococcales bacterium]|nr:nitrogenase iron-molybdenum cofactor biosynthesis protein NifE [Magnetococcales bacterium]
MKASEIAQLLDEPACAHNHGEKSGCARLKPGATAGGCSFDGAQITLFPIADAAHIVHGAMTCAGASWNGRGSLASGPELHRLGLTTDLSEQDVILGRGEKRLLFAIKQAVETLHPAAVFCYQTCVPALIGDDLAAICQAAESRFGIPVIAVDAAGFYGTKNLGNRIAGDTLVNQVIGRVEPQPRPAVWGQQAVPVYDVALIGEFNIAGEFWQVHPLFDELGLRLLCTLAGDARYRQVASLHRSQVNMLVCSKALVNVARRLEERYGIPWFEGSFYGMADTSQSLRDFARLLGDEGLKQRTEALIAREESRLRQRLEPYRQRLRGKRALLYTGGVKSWSVIAALQELGVEVVATGTRKSTSQDKERIRALMGDEALMLDDGNPLKLLEVCRAEKADLLMAGGRNMYTALKARLPFLDINQEREEAYAGYEGLVTLAKNLLATLESPVWERVRRPAPWDESGRTIREAC